MAAASGQTQAEGTWSMGVGWGLLPRRKGFKMLKGTLEKEQTCLLSVGGGEAVGGEAVGAAARAFPVPGRGY